MSCYVIFAHCLNFQSYHIVFYSHALIVELLRISDCSKKPHAFVPYNKVKRLIGNKKNNFLASTFTIFFSPVIKCTFQTHICPHIPPFREFTRTTVRCITHSGTTQVPSQLPDIQLLIRNIPLCSNIHD